MSQAQAAETAASPTAAPADRATSFQAVQGEPEHYSGAALLVTAYAIVWTILLVWVGLLWRKQSALNGRLDDLERVLEATTAQHRKSGR